MRMITSYISNYRYENQPEIKPIETACKSCGAWSVGKIKCDYCGNMFYNPRISGETRPKNIAMGGF